jgi:adenosylcobinamide-GDP ribazoletransferase
VRFVSACAQEIRLMLTSLQFFTRVPVPGWVWSHGWRPTQLNASARYFPLVGAAVGLVCGGVLVGALRLWPPAVAVVVSMAVGFVLTGSFHEDGLADSCDGFGGGRDRAKILEIMKDSRVGSYATVGVWAVLTLKMSVLSQMALWPAGRLLAVVVASHSTSRMAALWVMARLTYVRDDAQAKSKPIAQGVSARALVAALVMTAAVCAPLGDEAAAAALLSALATAEVAVAYLRRRLGGYVGDALGATQQLAEVSVLLSIWIAFKTIWISS